jgi:hypothetical protein
MRNADARSRTLVTVGNHHPTLVCYQQLTKVTMVLPRLRRVLGTHWFSAASPAQGLRFSFEMALRGRSKFETGRAICLTQNEIPRYFPL